MKSLIDFFFNRQPNKPVCAASQLSFEFLEILRRDISRAQMMLDRTSSLSEITIGDVVVAAHNLRLAQVTLATLTEQAKHK